MKVRASVKKICPEC
ncbi:MAG: 50S ribosomal protein L36, partial [bacterium (Candidatus Ratteibacteria) CG23_combo_of_CG06-09_8_20_14_all_48_7]